MYYRDVWRSLGAVIEFSLKINKIKKDCYKEERGHELDIVFHLQPNSLILHVVLKQLLIDRP